MKPISEPGAQPAAPRANAGRIRKLFEVARDLESRVREGTPADEWLAGWFRAHRECGSRDRRFLSDTLFSAFRWRGWIGSFGERGPSALLAAYQLQATESDDLTTALAAAAGMPADRIPPLGLSPLEEKSRVLAMAFGESELSINRLIPDWTPAALAGPAGLEPAAFLRSSVEAFQFRPPLWLTALKGTSGELAARLRAVGLTAVSDGRLPGAVRVEARVQLQELEKKIGPCFEVQDLASQAVVAACEAKPGQAWWDVCAGGGGKALGLALRVGRSGRVSATDVREAPVRETLRRARRAGLSNLFAARQSGLDLPPAPGRFDGVLADAPCSGLGTWGRNPDARWRISENDVVEKAGFQAKLLAAAARAVVSGGILVYSACTLTRAETTEAVREFTQTHPEFEIEPFAHPLDATRIASEQWILPGQGPCGGMFIARWRRGMPA